MMARRLNSKSPRAPRACRPRTYSPSNFTSQNYRTGVPVHRGARSAFPPSLRPRYLPCEFEIVTAPFSSPAHRTALSKTGQYHLRYTVLCTPLHLAASHRTIEVHSGTKVASHPRPGAVGG